MSDIFERIAKNRRAELILRILVVLVLLYGFLIGVSTLSGGLKMLGSGFAKSLFDLTSNPLLALMAGMLGTVLFQSSSVSTSIIVGLVASGTLSIPGAIPMVMGANLGTSVTNTLVSLGFARSTVNFKRAFAAATVHDFFNILSVAIILPFELATGALSRTATLIANGLYGSASGVQFSSPLKAAIKPAVELLKTIVVQASSEGLAPVVMIGLAALMILTSLTFIVKTMTKVIEDNQGNLVDSVLSKSPLGTVLIGVGCTIAVQSSSITTSLLVPLAGSGLLSLQTIYAVTIGANIGTTATALLAAMTGNIAGLTIALVHLLFNLLGTFLFFAHPTTRQIPTWCAEQLAASVERKKIMSLGYIGTLFFCIPLSLIFILK